MVSLSGCIRTCLSANAYEARMSDLYLDGRRGRKVTCQECGLDMAMGFLRSHLETQHDVYTSFALRATDAAPPAAPRRLLAIFNVEEGTSRRASTAVEVRKC